MIVCPKSNITALSMRGLYSQEEPLNRGGNNLQSRSPGIGSSHERPINWLSAPRWFGPHSVSRSGSRQNLAISAPGPVLMPNLLCPGQEKRTMHKPDVHVGNFE